MNAQNWVEKHRPESFDDIQGNNKALTRIENWANNWEKGDEVLLLHGPAGVGKTTTAYVVSKALGAKMNQVNASDDRRKEDVESLVSEMMMRGVDGEMQLIFLDEVDNWASASALKPMAEALDHPVNPVMMSCNDVYDVPDNISKHKNVEQIKFKLSKASRRAKIKEIADRENIDLDKETLKRLSQRKDLRAAINDLQMIKHDGSIEYDSRSSEINIFEATTRAQNGDGTAVYAVEDDPSLFIQWLDENLSKEFAGKELAYAYDALSRADIMLERTGSTQNYRYWKWASEFMKYAAEARERAPVDNTYYMDTGSPDWDVLRNPSNQYPGLHELFNHLKDTEGGSYQFAGSFAEFIRIIVPILKEQPKEDKFQLALNAGFIGQSQDGGVEHEKALKALDIDPKEYEDWVNEEAPEKSEWVPDEDDALAW